jgi:hypothetical protein
MSPIALVLILGICALGAYRGWDLIQEAYVHAGVMVWVLCLILAGSSIAIYAGG